MATILDPRDDLAGLEAELARTEVELRQQALVAAPGGTSLDGNLDRLVRETARLEARIGAIKGFAASPSAANLDSALVDARRERNAAGRRILARYDKRTEAVRVAVDLYRQLAEALPAIDEATTEMRVDWNTHVDGSDNRRMDIYSGIRQALAQRPIDGWKEAAGKVIMNLEVTSADAVRAGQDLAQLLEDNKREMLKRFAREFPDLSE